MLGVQVGVAQTRFFLALLSEGIAGLAPGLGLVHMLLSPYLLRENT